MKNKKDEKMEKMDIPTILRYLLQRFLPPSPFTSQPSSSHRKHYQRFAVVLLTVACTIYKRTGKRVEYAKKIRKLFIFPRDRELKLKIMKVLYRLFKIPDYACAEYVSLSVLNAAIQKKIVTRALIGSTEIIFRSKKEGWKRTQLPSQSPELQKQLVDFLSRNGSDISALPGSIWSKLSPIILTAIPFLYLAFAYRMFKGLHNDGGIGDADFFSSKLLTISKNENKSIVNKKTILFSDVAGLESILPEVQDIVSYLRDPSLFQKLGAEPRSLLLHGSPGVGKTMIAKAIAGEADCDAFCACSGSDFCEMYVGRGAARIRMLFREARKVALQNYTRRQCVKTERRLWPWGSSTKSMHVGGDDDDDEAKRISKPATAIIFIDELDALAKSRISTNNDERDQTLNQLLTEMDGFQINNDPVTVIVIVIAATNLPHALDPAILRRFDRKILVPYPDYQGRIDILKVHAAKTQCRFSSIHWDYLAHQTPNFSGSDLKAIVNDAALLAVRQSSKHIEQGHLLQAIQRSRAMKVQQNRNNCNLNQECKEPPLLHPFSWYSESDEHGSS